MTEKVTTRKARTAVQGSPLRYLLIDGTDPQDSVIFGALLERHRGWRNLIDEGLFQPAPDDPNRLVDPLHPYLPIYRLSAPGSKKKVAVVCVMGGQVKPVVGPGFGLDDFWVALDDKKAPPKIPMMDVDGTPIRTRRDAIVAANKFAGALALQPTVAQQSPEHRPSVFLGDVRHPSHSMRVADLLYISSHGYLGGFMTSNPAVDPDGGRKVFHADPFLSAGLQAAREQGFHGPRWIVLAQCSSLSKPTWSLWAKVLMKSSPPVHGILAYGEASPSASRAVNVARRFFGSLSAGEPFLQSWKTANHGIQWAAIVHKDAVNDSLQSFSHHPSVRLPPATKPPFSTPYRGFGEREPDAGIPIALSMASPFSLRIISNGKYPGEILPETLHEFCAAYAREQRFRFTLTPPHGEGLLSATFELVNIRRTYQKQVPWSEAFILDTFSQGSSFSGAQTTTLKATFPKPAKECTFEGARPLHLNRALEPMHSFLWIRASIRTNKRSLSADFPTLGLTVYE